MEKQKKAFMKLNLTYLIITIAIFCVIGIMFFDSYLRMQWSAYLYLPLLLYSWYAISIIVVVANLYLRYSFAKNDSDKFLKKVGNYSPITEISGIRKGKIKKYEEKKNEYCIYAHSIKKGFIKCEFAMAKITDDIDDVHVRCANPKNGCVKDSEKLAITNDKHLATR